MPLKRIIVYGATSRVGPGILDALVAARPHFEVTILLRASSKSPPKYPGVKHITLGSDSSSLDEYTRVLHGFDALVCALGAGTSDIQCLLADACAAAKVPRYILADYGSVSSADPVAQDLLDLYKIKARVRDYAASVCDKHPGTTWTSLITGHFFDYGLRSELLGFDIPDAKVTLFDGGKTRWSSSTVAQIGRAVAKVLQHQEETVNRLLYVQSFCHSQLDVLAAVEKAKGEKLKRIDVSSDKWIKERLPKAREGDAEVIDEIVAALGITRSNWEDGRKSFANGMLGLEEEDLTEVVQSVVGKVKGASWSCSIL